MAKLSRYTVCVVDDDAAVCDSVRELVESVGLAAETHASARAFLQSNSPDECACLVVDVRMGGASGLALQEELNTRGIDVPIIFITGHGDIPMAVAALQAGAVDFIEKPYREQHLLDSINTAVGKSENAGDSDDLEQRLAELTQRELEIYEKIMGGGSSKSIARELDISPRTVETHRHNLLQKLGFASVSQLIVHKARSFVTGRPHQRAV